MGPNAESVQLLLAAKGNPNAETSVSSLPIANILMQLCGAELCGLLMPQDKTTPLHFAATGGHTESVRLLRAANGNPNAENSVSSLPIANVIKLYGDELCGGLVLQQGMIPRKMAMLNGHTECVKALKPDTSCAIQ